MNINFGTQSDQNHGFTHQSPDKPNSDEKKISQENVIIPKLSLLPYDKSLQNVKLEPVNSNLNKVADDHFREIAREKGMRDEDIEIHLKYIENNYEKWKLAGQNIRIKKLGKEGLARTIEFLADTGTVVTHFKRKILDLSGKIVKGAPLGEGQFAIVKLSIINMSEKLQGSAWVADKVIKDLSLAQNTIEEGNINKTFDSSSNVRRCYRINDKGLLLEGMKGNLKTHKILNQTEMFKILKDIITGVTEIHQRGYVHQDLHSENILVSYDDVWKIGDLGSTQNTFDINTKPIHLAIASPNLIRSYAFNINFYADRAEDVWALGIMFYELENGNLPIFATVESCQPLALAVKELNNCRKKIQSLDDEDSKYQIFSGHLDLEIQNSNLQNEEVIALSKPYIVLRNEVRKQLQSRHDTITYFFDNYQPKNEFGELIKKMLNPDAKNRISLKKVKEIIEKIDTEQITNTVNSHKINNSQIKLKSLDLASTYSKNEIVYDDDGFDGMLRQSMNYSKYRKIQITTKDSDLVSAAYMLDINFLKKKLTEGYDIAGWRNSNNKTLLQLVIKNFTFIDAKDFDKYFSLINFLLNLEEDVDAKNTRNTLDESIIQLLLLETENVRSSYATFHAAIKTGRLEIVKFFYEKEPNFLKAVNNGGENAIHIAAECGYFEILKFLYDKHNIL